MKNDEDRKLFLKAMQDVQPLKAKPVSTSSAPKPVFRLQPRQPDYPDLRYSIEEKVSSEEMLSFSRPGLSWQVLRQLKRGDWPYEQRLDLHGRTQAEAESLLLKHISEAQNQGRRVLLVIHGKARTGDYPILKNLSYALLKEHPEVLAFCSTPVKHGGSGSLYVLIKQP